MKTILAPIDFSTATDGVVEVAATLARSTQSRVVLLHIVQPPVLTSDYGLAMENFQEAIDISQKHSAKRLTELTEGLRRRHPDLPVETQLVNGPPLIEILDAVKKYDATYIVMGSHGHNAFYDLLVGTTTHGILRKATCPVVIVPPPQRAKKAMAAQV
jgi:nucleotide-binding universal stress UspA family protein